MPSHVRVLKAEKTEMATGQGEPPPMLKSADQSERGVREQPCSIRRYRRGDESQINELFNSVFGHGRDLAEWSWKFNDAPVEDVNLTVMAESNERLVGQYACIPMSFKCGQEIVRTAQPVDNVIHPSFQAQGIQKKMFEFWEKTVLPAERVVFSFGLPNRAAYAVGKRSLGYKDLCGLPTLYRRLNWRLAARRRAPWLPRAGVEIVRFASAWCYRSLLSKSASPAGPLRVEQAERFDSRVDRFWERVKGTYEILGVRSERYLNWRYVAKPGDRYHRLIGLRREEAVGFAVLKIVPEGDVLVGYIVDLISLPEPAVEDALVSAALETLCAERVDFSLCRFLKEDRVYRALCRHGFSERPDFGPVPVVFKVSPYGASRVEESALKDVRRWHLSMGDSDGI